MTYAERMIAAAEARGDPAGVKYWRRIAATVDQAPPLAQSQRDQLRVLLRVEPQSAPTLARTAASP